MRNCVSIGNSFSDTGLSGLEFCTPLPAQPSLIGLYAVLSLFFMAMSFIQSRQFPAPMHFHESIRCTSGDKRARPHQPLPLVAPDAPPPRPVAPVLAAVIQ